ncbi:unnamed protein product [Penicillium discolor]
MRSRDSAARSCWPRSASPATRSARSRWPTGTPAASLRASTPMVPNGGRAPMRSTRRRSRRRRSRWACTSRATRCGRASTTRPGPTVDYLATFVGGSYPPNNWAWFRVLVEQFLESVGAPFSATDRATDLALLDGFERAGGWSADGAARSFDHYAGWALSFYPLLWADIVGEEPRHTDRVARYRRRLDAFLDDALHLVGADGGPLILGRSLTYRFATAAAAGVAAFSGTSRHDPGLLRRAVSGQVRHFTARGAPDATGVLPLGWYGAWRPLAQDYSGPGSPYWAAKGLLPLALPAAHPFWTAVEQPLPIDRGPFTRVLLAPGWLATGTPDGIVRVVNHGTDHRTPAPRPPPFSPAPGHATRSTARSPWCAAAEPATARAS